MTFLRRVAVGISERVVRWASPGCKEWAEGLAREAEFIESDWRALVWALDSTRVLLDRRPAPIRSLVEVPEAAGKFVEQICRGSWMTALMVQGVVNVVEYRKRSNVGSHAGLPLILVGSAIAGLIVAFDQRRVKNLWKGEVYENPLACAMFYRSELGRHLYRINVQALAFSSFIAGAMLDAHGSVRRSSLSSGVHGLMWAAPVLLGFLWARRRTERKIHEIEALLASVEQRIPELANGESR